MHNKQQLQNSLSRTISRVAASALAMAIVFVLLIFFTQSGQAQTYKVIYTFTGGIDGAAPDAGLTVDAAGNFYGTTRYGGSAGAGSVFRLSNTGTGWSLTTLYSFAGGNDGTNPEAGVVFGPDGRLYGTTRNGGGVGCEFYGGCGTVFSLTPSATACNSALCP
jgi:uncharacterized repeat protein (TIGR03803 family)